MILDGPPPRPHRLRAGLALATLAALALPAWGVAQQPATESPATSSNQPLSPTQVPATEAPATSPTPTDAPAQQPAAEAPVTPSTQPVAPAQPEPNTPSPSVVKAPAEPSPHGLGPDEINDLDDEVRRRFQSDHEVKKAQERIFELQDRIKKIRTVVKTSDDPALKRLIRLFEEERAAYDKLWTEMEPKLREEIRRRETRQNSRTITVLQARRDGKLAELRKAEAARDLARSTMVRTQRYADRKVVSQDELETAKTALQIAEAEVDVHKAALVEAEAELLGAQARPGDGRAASASPFRVADPNAAAIHQVRRAGKLAELHKAEAARDAARVAVNRNQKLQAKGKAYVSEEEAARAEAELRDAEAEVEIRRASLAEIDLQQGKGEPGPASAPPAPQDERIVRLRKAEAQRDMAAVVVARDERLRTKGPNYVSEEEIKRAKAELQAAEAEVRERRAELGLAVNNPPPAEPIRTAWPLAELRDELELAELRVEQNEISRREAEEAMNRIEQERSKLRSTPAAGDLAIMADLERVEGERRAVAQRLATLREAAPELKLKATQARRRVEAELARVRRDAEQAKGRLKWAEDLMKKGYISPAQCDEYRNRYEELMTLIGPDPRPAVTSEPTAAPPVLPPAPAPAPEGR